MGALNNLTHCYSANQVHTCSFFPQKQFRKLVALYTLIDGAVTCVGNRSVWLCVCYVLSSRKWGIAHSAEKRNCWPCINSMRVLLCMYFLFLIILQFVRNCDEWEGPQIRRAFIMRWSKVLLLLLSWIFHSCSIFVSLKVTERGRMKKK